MKHWRRLQPGQLTIFHILRWPLWFPADFLSNTHFECVWICVYWACMHACGFSSMCICAQTWPYTLLCSHSDTPCDGFWPSGEFLIKVNHVSVSTVADASGSYFKRPYQIRFSNESRWKSSLRLHHERNIAIEAAEGGNKWETVSITPLRLCQRVSGNLPHTPTAAATDGRTHCLSLCLRIILARMLSSTAQTFCLWLPLSLLSCCKMSTSARLQCLDRHYLKTQ